MSCSNGLATVDWVKHCQPPSRMLTQLFFSHSVINLFSICLRYDTCSLQLKPSAAHVQPWCRAIPLQHNISTQRHSNRIHQNTTIFTCIVTLKTWLTQARVPMAYQTQVVTVRGELALFLLLCFLGANIILTYHKNSLWANRCILVVFRANADDEWLSPGRVIHPTLYTVSPNYARCSRQRAEDS